MQTEKTTALQVLIASGPEALDRAVLGFAFALSAATAGVAVTVVLALQGTAWIKESLPEATQPVNGFSSIAEYMELLEENNVLVRLCSSCVGDRCTVGRPDVAGAQYIGLTELAIQTVAGAAQTVVF